VYPKGTGKDDTPIDGRTPIIAPSSPTACREAGFNLNEEEWRADLVRIESIAERRDSTITVFKLK
jgi:hypothetical protein